MNAEGLNSKLEELEKRLRYLTDRQEILDVFRRYARGLNRYDMDLLHGAFWPDAQVNYGFDTRTSGEWISYWQGHFQQGNTSQAHHITNETIDIDGDIAHVESYLIAFRRQRDDKATRIAGGRYIDRFDRRMGEWRIAVREFIPHIWLETNSVFNANFNDSLWPQTGWALGTCDRSDPSYTRPLERRQYQRPQVGITDERK